MVDPTGRTVVTPTSAREAEQARKAHVAADVGRFLLGVASVVFAMFFAVLVLWLVLSEPKTKLYEADNVVCQQSPLTAQCWHR